ncbi:hypothetical protein REH65_01765 [Saccharopolyspora sp. ID03-671]|uniref:hypothetical protein n=1 Tax=Saccharopolyspora sp. ID03-671 TaxID=3073066 RepID=UPI00324C3B1C
MSAEVIREGIRHRCTHISLWDSKATTLCGKKFQSGSYKTPVIYWGVTCADCRKVKVEA